MNEQQKADRRKQRLMGRMRKGAFGVVDRRKEMVSTRYMTREERRAAMEELQAVETGLGGVFGK